MLRRWTPPDRMLLIALGFLAVGLLLGAAGMRRAGRMTRRLTGPWRPGAGVAALIALIGSAGLAARGAVLEGGLLAVLGLGLAVAARRRPPRPAAPADGMSVEDARRTLGVGPDADRDEVEAAYRRLMRRVHPDVGGAPGLASQLNLAREVLAKAL